MSRDLSVALVSRSNAEGGGASRIAEELAAWFQTKGFKAIHYCAFPIGDLKDFQRNLYPSGLQGRLIRSSRRWSRRLGFGDLIPAEYWSTLREAVREFDIVHFHDLNTAISPLTLQLCSRNKPVTITAHDCSSFTGGCIYPLGCERYLEECGQCPQLDALGAKFDFTKAGIKINRTVACQPRVQYIFPSGWLRNTASRSMEFGRPPAHIPNGFSDDSYRFPSKAEARRVLGIAQDQKVVVVGAHYIADPRKGVAFALAAIRAVADLSPLVIFVGNPPTDLEAKLPGVSYWLTGFVSDKRKLGILYAASDAFLFTSLEDNLPIMIQEALAAGTAVVGFAAGGVSEMVDHKRTGLLCPVRDQEALNENLRLALTQINLSEFAQAAKESVRERYDMDLAGQRHVTLYEAMLQ